MLIGYARVSTQGQDLDQQRAARLVEVERPKAAVEAENHGREEVAAQSNS